MKHINPLFTTIALDYLFIETLETRNADHLDYHAVSVWGVRGALAAAYEAGRRSAHPGLLEAAELVVSRWESGDLAGAVRMLDEAIAKARASRRSADLSLLDNARLDTAAPALLEALLLARTALNAAPRFRVGDSDSYKIAAIVDRAIAEAKAACCVHRPSAPQWQLSPDATESRS